MPESHEPLVPRREVRAVAVVLAAGTGTRSQSEINKVFLPLAGHSVIGWSLQALGSAAGIERFVLVIRESDRELVQRVITSEMLDFPVELVAGGSTRHESESLALRHLQGAIEAEEVNLVLIHDGARPLLSHSMLAELIDAAAECGAAFPGLLMDDLASVDAAGTLLERNLGSMVGAQTPQVFEAKTLLAAYTNAQDDDFVGTDTASCVVAYSDQMLHWVPGDPRNIKITFPGDIVQAEKILRDNNFRLD
ncbi:2-C-methyl-D-erythritol 4-phosphate cytidylyltransferase [Nakamurella antarctica]|uniref:2-C-methyl-D-erythritol 4-phosphate cytidylyltransferase n=1 Tax=Nakamurella antarctica TaxID=1902245 RepID=A0A3G8ZMP1_9ACTN|nr:IspD/TarI family cytidylyltransferase [Nakamurella antarctica]AZI58612.1 2-C-methyl-D-erythritol 4-phosphate cytidylyltransferase [Nakamurella antarctica]